jgi:hypothetical protein
MTFLPPYAITGVHRMQEPDIARAAARYEALLHVLQADEVDAEAVADLSLLNEAVDARLDTMVTA